MIFFIPMPQPYSAPSRTAPIVPNKYSDTPPKKVNSGASFDKAANEYIEKLENKE